MVKKDGRWELGACVQKSEPRSYIVNVGGKLYRRNRKFLKTTKEKDIEQNISEEWSGRVQFREYSPLKNVAENSG